MKHRLQVCLLASDRSRVLVRVRVRAGSYRGSHGARGGYRGQQGATGGGVTGDYMGTQGATGGHMGLEGVTGACLLNAPPTGVQCIVVTTVLSEVVIMCIN